MSSDNTHSLRRPDKKTGREGRTGLAEKPSEALAMRLTAVDSLNWSHPDKEYRVRLHVAPLPEGLEGIDRVRAMGERRRSLGGLLGSKTKAKNFHGYLEGDYEMATHGFYTNNLVGLRRLFAKYPGLFDSVQSRAQYRAARELSDALNQPENH